MSEQKEQPLIGLVPAAGRASRLGPLPCSKEVFPIGACAPSETSLPDVTCHHLLRCIKNAGAQRAYVVLRQGKWDIPAYLGDGSALDLPLGYLMRRLPHGVPFTLDQAYPFVSEAHVLLGFPDILFKPKDAFQHILSRQAETGAEVVLGLFPAPRPQKTDMVDRDTDGRVRSISVKPTQTELRYTWVIAVWTPVFTRFMHSYVASAHGNGAPPKAEVHAGHVLQRALEQGLYVDSVCFPQGRYLDLGTPETLRQAVSNPEVFGSYHRG